MPDFIDPTNTRLHARRRVGLVPNPKKRCDCFSPLRVRGTKAVT